MDQFKMLQISDHGFLPWMQAHHAPSMEIPDATFVAGNKRNPNLSRGWLLIHLGPTIAGKGASAIHKLSVGISYGLLGAVIFSTLKYAMPITKYCTTMVWLSLILAI